MTFSEKLLLLRKQKRLSQEQLAEMLDVSRQSVSKWESQQTLPEPSKLILISQIFNVTIDQLLKDDMPMEGDEERTAANAEAAEPAPAVGKLDMMFCTQLRNAGGKTGRTARSAATAAILSFPSWRTSPKAGS